VKDSLKRNRNWSAQVLTAVAGFVDLTGWVVLYHIYTANMTGNTVAAGLRIGRGDWIRAAARLLPVAAFAVGVLANGIVVRWLRAGNPNDWYSPSSWQPRLYCWPHFWGSDYGSCRRTA